MFSSKFNKYNNRTKVKKLINLGLFDEHIDELSKALYGKRTFTKDIKCYFNKMNNHEIENYLTPKNHRKIFLKELKTKTSPFQSEQFKNKKSNKFNKHNEDVFNEEMKHLLKLLNISQEETMYKFQEIKEENDYFISLYKIYKELIDKKLRNKKFNDDNVFMFLYDLLLKYKHSKNLSFELSSLFSDILKETPLASTDLEKLKFYYIINPDRFNIINPKKNIDDNLNIKKENKVNPLLAMYNYNSENSSTDKNKLLKEPKIIDITKIKNLKEMKYLNRINKRVKFKIINGGKIIGIVPHKLKPLKLERLNDSVNENDNKYIQKDKLENSNEEIEDNEDNIFDFENYEDIIEEKKENNLNLKELREKMKLEINKDIEDIKKLKKTIKDTFKSENNGTLKLKKSHTIYEGLQNKKIKKRNISFIKENSLSNYNLLSNLNNDLFKLKLKRAGSLKISNNDEDMKDLFYKSQNNSIYNNSFLSNRNDYQPSTYYSNYSRKKNKNITIISKLSPETTINLLNKFNSTKNKQTNLIEDNLVSLKINKKVGCDDFHFNNSKIKTLKKSKTLYKEYIVQNITNNKTEKVLEESNKIKEKKKEKYRNKINDYLKFKDNSLPLIYKENSLKNTYYFLNRIKNEIQNKNIKYKIQNVKKYLNENDRQKLNDLDILDSNIINKGRELLVKILKNKI